MPRTSSTARPAAARCSRSTMRPRREPAPSAEALDERAAETRRRRRAHRLGRRQPQRRARTAPRRRRAPATQAHRHGATSVRASSANAQAGKAKEVARRVRSCRRRAEPPSATPTSAPSDATISDQLEVVQADRAVAVAERLEHRDLRALVADQARQHDVEQEGGDAEEDRRARSSPSLRSCVELVVEEAVRQLLVAAERAERRRRARAARSTRRAPSRSRRAGRERAATTSLKAPSMSKAGASARAASSSTPKRCGRRA